jgi:hypothetical protein
MQALRQMGGGIVIAIISLLLVVGGISLALSETKSPEQPTATPLPPIIATSLEQPTLAPIIAATNTIEIPTLAATVLPSATIAAPIVCNPPSGWIRCIPSRKDIKPQLKF